MEGGLCSCRMEVTEAIADVFADVLDFDNPRKIPMVEEILELTEFPKEAYVADHGYIDNLEPRGYMESYKVHFCCKRERIWMIEHLMRKNHLFLTLSR